MTLNMKNSIPILLTLISFLLLISCASQKERTDKFLKNNPIYLAEKCALNFPPTTKYIPGKTITDTIIKKEPGIEVPCPEFKDESGNIQKPTAKCPDQKIVELISHRTDTIYLENTANLMRLTGENALLTIDNQNLENKIKGQKKDIIAMSFIIGLLGLGLYLKIK
jgi:hypothetical protein